MKATPTSWANLTDRQRVTFMRQEAIRRGVSVKTLAGTLSEPQWRDAYANRPERAINPVTDWGGSADRNDDGTCEVCGSDRRDVTGALLHTNELCFK